MKSAIVPILIITLGFAAIIGTSDLIDKQKPQLPESFADADLTLNGSRLKGFVFGMEGLLADWYWVRGLQYIGGKVLRSRERNESFDIENLTTLNPRLLYPMLENATDLDPHFVEAYSYGAIVLPSIDKEQAVRFAKKGIDNNPQQWRLYQQLGFTYWKLGDFEKAGDAYSRGASIPGATPFLGLMAAAMKTEGSSRATGRSIYREMLANAQDEPSRVTAERRLMEFDWLDERDAIDAVLADYRSKIGRCPSSLGDIFPSLQKVRLPGGRDFQIDAAGRLVDPSAVPYLLDREACVVKLDPENSKVPQHKL